LNIKNLNKIKTESYYTVEGTEMKKFKFEVEGYRKVVSKKNKLKFNRSGRAYKLKDVIEFENYVSEICYDKMNELDISVTDKEVSMRLDVVFGDRRIRDLPNCYDCVCDSMNAIVYKDDCQIVELSGSKKYEKGIWKFKITVEEI